jgi:hypothetical protein
VGRRRVGRGGSDDSGLTSFGSIDLRGKQIFRKQQLGPGQLRAVAERRWGDARYLCMSGRNDRANGAMYLGGFVIECLLKAKLMEKYRWLANASPGQIQDASKRWIWNLCHRLHDLDEILEALPEVHTRVAAMEQMGQPRLTYGLRSLCAEWTIYARYSPLSADIEDAREFLERVEEIKKWLR